jgi:hypothetical protein
VLEGKWKLVLLGPQRHLFDTSTPDGETRNLLATYPAIGDRLYAKLKAWDATLQVPGLPTEKNPQDAAFFATHVEKIPGSAPEATPPAKAAKRKRKQP